MIRNYLLLKVCPTLHSWLNICAVFCGFDQTHRTFSREWIVASFEWYRDDMLIVGDWWSVSNLTFRLLPMIITIRDCYWWEYEDGESSTKKWKQGIAHQWQVINWADGNALRQQTLLLSNACYNQNDQRWLYSIGCCQNFCGISLCVLCCKD